MRKIILGLLAVVLLGSTVGNSQLVPFPQSLPPNTVVGRLGISAGPAQAIPFAILSSNLSTSIFGFTTNGDSDFTIPGTTRTVVTSAALTAPRTWTLPAAAVMTAGQPLCILDQAGGVTSTNTLMVQRAGADTINGATNVVFRSSFYGACFVADGVSKWTAATFGFLSDPIAVNKGGTGLASGTSGGIPYYSGATTIASSAALTANLPVIGGGAGVAPSVGTVSGNTTKFVTSTGTLTNGHCVSIDANGNYVDAGAACGAGSAPTKQYLLSGSGATYTTPGSARSLHIAFCGGGGGGGAAATNAGANGTTTTFNSINAAPGSGGATGVTGTGGAGGSGGTGSANFRLTGSGGSAGGGGTGTQVAGGTGGSGIWGTGAGQGRNQAAGIAGGANTCAGGSGGSANAVGSGAGGGAGEYVELIITSPAATYTYTIGGGGTGGAAGSAAGGNGATGVVVVTEYYKWLMQQPWSAVPGMLPPANDNLFNDVDLKEAA
jgi:hypothetical protein